MAQLGETLWNILGNDNNTAQQVQQHYINFFLENNAEGNRIAPNEVSLAIRAEIDNGIDVNSLINRIKNYINLDVTTSYRVTAYFLYAYNRRLARDGRSIPNYDHYLSQIDAIRQQALAQEEAQQRAQYAQQRAQQREQQLQLQQQQLQSQLQQSQLQTQQIQQRLQQLQQQYIQQIPLQQQDIQQIQQLQQQVRQQQRSLRSLRSLLGQLQHIDLQQLRELRELQQQARQLLERQYLQLQQLEQLERQTQYLQLSQRLQQGRQPSQTQQQTPLEQQLHQARLQREQLLQQREQLQQQIRPPITTNNPLYQQLAQTRLQLEQQEQQIQQLVNQQRGQRLSQRLQQLLRSSPPPRIDVSLIQEQIDRNGPSELLQEALDREMTGDHYDLPIGASLVDIGFEHPVFENAQDQINRSDRLRTAVVDAINLGEGDQEQARVAYLVYDVMNLYFLELEKKNLIRIIKNLEYDLNLTTDLLKKDQIKDQIRLYNLELKECNDDILFNSPKFIEVYNELVSIVGPENVYNLREKLEDIFSNSKLTVDELKELRNKGISFDIINDIANLNPRLKKILTRNVFLFSTKKKKMNKTRKSKKRSKRTSKRNSKRK